MSTIAQTPHQEIVLHDDFDILICETDYDIHAYVYNVWWLLDESGYLSSKAIIH